MHANIRNGVGNCQFLFFNCVVLRISVEIIIGQRMPWVDEDACMK